MATKARKTKTKADPIKRRIKSVTERPKKRRKPSKRLSAKEKLSAKRAAARLKNRKKPADKKLDSKRAKFLRGRAKAATKNKGSYARKVKEPSKKGLLKLLKATKLEYIANGHWNALPKRKRDLLEKAKAMDFEKPVKGLTMEEIKAAADGFKGPAKLSIRRTSVKSKKKRKIN